jgi:hypothetical protein
LAIPRQSILIHFPLAVQSRHRNFEAHDALQHGAEKICGEVILAATLSRMAANLFPSSALFSKSGPPNFCTDFGANIRASNSTTKSEVSGLSVALIMFERSYNRIGDRMPAFIALCENQLTKND